MPPLLIGMGVLVQHAWVGFFIAHARAHATTCTDQKLQLYQASSYELSFVHGDLGAMDPTKRDNVIARLLRIGAPGDPR